MPVGSSLPGPPGIHTAVRDPAPHDTYSMPLPNRPIRFSALPRALTTDSTSDPSSGRHAKRYRDKAVGPQDPTIDPSGQGPEMAPGRMGA